MSTTEVTEAYVESAGTIMVAPPTLHGHAGVGEFFGSVISPEDLVAGAVDLAGKTVYLCGDVSEIDATQLRSAARVFTVRGLSADHDGKTAAPWPVVDPGRIPTRVHGVGVYYPRFFAPEDDHFGRISAEHAFQSLTESTKPGTARRSGIYLTPVTRDGDALHFRLLRCSTNLSGPTETFRPTDTGIVEALNREADAVFRNHAPLNHVLAQIYHNTVATPERKQSKAKISAHADKTKDMPANGIMAFCTFYDGLDKLHPLPGDPFDHGLKGSSGLTRLHFRLKDPAGVRNEAALPAQFTVTLHPGSVFLMPLSTNRLYTHEIRPSALDAELLPTRLGYVVRCSDTEAVHQNGDTFLKRGDAVLKLGPPTEEGMNELRRLYAEENRTSSFIDYGDAFLFSMNTGDYLAPRI
ncbi:hypothetical protein ACIO3O_13710 [Streptomyces sp. NPDC087440]|uniref:hypothetical protein n=1 Tax=Streptomyces sp. NPDC087440 TaxID=3365790 RepID=UPI00382D42AF